MSPRLPRITASELLRALHRDGWQIVRQSGSHATPRHPAKPGRLTIPRHAGVTLKPKTLQEILAQAGLSLDELRQLL